MDDVGDDDVGNADAGLGEERFEEYVVELRRCFNKQTTHINEMFADLKDYVRSEIRAALDPKGKRTSDPDTSGPSMTRPKTKAKKRKGKSQPVDVGMKRSSRLKNMTTTDHFGAEDSSDEDREECLGDKGLSDLPVECVRLSTLHVFLSTLVNIW